MVRIILVWHTKTNADNRTLPFPVNGSPSARFRKRNVTDVGKPTRTRPEARGANNRTLFRSLLHFSSANMFDSCARSFLNYNIHVITIGKRKDTAYCTAFYRSPIGSIFNLCSLKTTISKIKT